MPAKNSANYIKTAIDSVLSSLPANSELIVVDDGSADNTRKIVEAFKDARLRPIYLDESIGVARALNLALSASRSQFVARMDSDDKSFPWRFSFQLRQFRLNPELDFLFSTAMVFGEGIKPYLLLPQLPVCLDDFTFKNYLMTQNPAVHPSLMAKSSVLRDLGGYRDMPAEDLDLWLRAAVKGHSFKRTGIPLVAIRSHEGQTTKKKEWQAEFRNQKTIKDLRAQLSETLDGAQSLSRWKEFMRKVEMQGLPKLFAPWKSHQTD